MSPSRYSFGVRGIRSGRWSESKWTNETEFDPGRSEMNSVLNKFYDQIYETPDLTIIRLPTHRDFVIPVDEENIRKTLDTVPRRYLAGLAAVVVLRGSKKQEKAFKNLFSYGRYMANVIYLHPFPRKYMAACYDAPPKPSVLIEYQRAGATITRDETYFWVRFDHASLKRFYLRDVLLHELGHHVDAKNLSSKTERKAEGFADWFAAEHGYRLPVRGGDKEGTK